MTPLERRRSLLEPADLAMIDHAGALTEELELALLMLSVACDLIAGVTGMARDHVVSALQYAAGGGT